MLNDWCYLDVVWTITHACPANFDMTTLPVIFVLFRNMHIIFHSALTRQPDFYFTYFSGLLLLRAMFFKIDSL